MTAHENESAILSCLLGHPEQSAPYVCSELRPDHFTGGNEEIFRQILALHGEGCGIDVMAVAGRLRDRQKLEAVGGFHAISSLASLGGVPMLLSEHIRAVKEKAAQRRILRVLTDAKDEAENPGCDVASLLSSLMTEVEEIGHDRARKKSPSTKDLVMQVIGRVQKRHDGDESEAGVSTGIKSLDRETGGMRPGTQWVIAGPAKGGKSSLAVTLMASAVVSHGRRCAFFGLEMPSVENVERLLCQIGRVSASTLRDGHLSERDFPALTAAAAKVAPAPLHFRDDIFDLSELIGTARQMKAAYPDLFAIFVDYAQLLGADEDERSREREVAVISRTLRKLSMQTGLCVILLSQVNDDGRLRESRSLGMDATTVVFIELDESPTVRKLRLVQRSGRSGIELRVAYIGEHFLFADLAEDHEPETQQAQRSQSRTKPRRQFQPD